MVGDAQELHVELAQLVGRHRGNDAVLAGEGDLVFVLARRPEGRLQRFVGLLELHVYIGDELVGLLGGHDSLVGEPPRELLPHGGMLCDLGNHQRLRVRSLVLLVVPEAAISHEVDDDVALEAAAEREREPDRRDRGFGIVRVDVDDRDVEALGEIARVTRRAALARIGGEADLVVGDHVQRAAGGITLERREVECLRDLALSGEGGVAVDEDRERDVRVVQAVAGRAVGLLRPRSPLDHRIDRLQVARVRREGDRDLA